MTGDAMIEWITITAKLDTGSGFAKTRYGEHVFVPAHICRPLEVGTTVCAQLVAQTGKSTPWKAVRLLELEVLRILDDGTTETAPAAGDAEFDVAAIASAISAAIVADLQPIIERAVRTELEEWE
mgnify:CR=1 FL=1